VQKDQSFPIQSIVKAATTSLPELFKLLWKVLGSYYDVMENNVPIPFSMKI